MELLGDVGEVEARFSLSSPDDLREFRLNVCLKRTDTISTGGGVPPARAQQGGTAPG